MQDPKLINEVLTSRYGKTLEGLPKFRLVWSEDLNEKRTGIHKKYYGPIYLGEHFGTEICKKYSYISEKWVLEVYTPEAKGNREIDSDGYEPLWVLMDKEGHYLPPNLEFCELVIAAWEFAKSGGNKKTDRMLAKEDQESFDREVKETEEVLEGEGSSPLMSQLHDGTAVTVDKEKEAN